MLPVRNVKKGGATNVNGKHTTPGALLGFGQAKSVSRDIISGFIHEE